jgi:hypothetical protein
MPEHVSINRGRRGSTRIDGNPNVRRHDPEGGRQFLNSHAMWFPATRPRNVWAKQKHPPNRHVQRRFRQKQQDDSASRQFVPGRTPINTREIRHFAGGMVSAV